MGQLRNFSKIKIFDWSNKKEVLLRQLDIACSGAAQSGKGHCFFVVSLEDYDQEHLVQLKKELKEQGYPEPKHGITEIWGKKAVVFRISLTDERFL